MQPSFRIVADGTDVTQRLNDRLLKLTLLDKPGMESDSLTLRLDDRDGQVALPRRGAVLEVHLGYAGEPLMRMGRFTVDTLQWAGPPDCLTVTAKAGDMRGSGKTIRSGGWEGTTLAQVCRDVGARNGWRVECPLQVAIARVDQVNESDYHFVTRLARQYDCTAKLAEGMLMVLPRQSGQSATGRRIEPLVLGRADVGSFDVTFDDRSLMRTVKTRYQLPGSGEVKSVELKNPRHRLRLWASMSTGISMPAVERPSRRRRLAWRASAAPAPVCAWNCQGVATCSPSAACCSKASRRESTASS